jgi:hypothetical protein
VSTFLRALATTHEPLWLPGLTSVINAADEPVPQTRDDNSLTRWSNSSTTSCATVVITPTRTCSRHAFNTEYPEQWLTDAMMRHRARTGNSKHGRFFLVELCDGWDYQDSEVAIVERGGPVVRNVVPVASDVYRWKVRRNEDRVRAWDVKLIYDDIRATEQDCVSNTMNR